jgi:HK97 gp10 family phage protein
MARTARMERLEKAKAKMNALPASIREGISKALDGAADEIVAAQQRMVPVSSGDLKRSIRKVRGAYKPENANVRGVSLGGGTSGLSDDLRIRIVAGDAKAWYARLVEFGTKGPRTIKNYWGHEGVEKTVPAAKASPFFFPAYRANKKRVKARVSRAVKKAAQQAAKG